MFEYIKGRIEEQTAQYVVVDFQGMGYRVFVSANTLTELPVGENVKIYLHPVFKEDAVSLYGFATKEEREIFRTVTGISGIGPKVAMGLLSQFKQDEFIAYIVSEDAKAISRAPGIGPKTASRIVLELKDKYKHYQPVQSVEGGAIEAVRAADNLFNEAVNGLLGLGYSYNEASSLVEKTLQPGMSIEDVLKAALMTANPFK